MSLKALSIVAVIALPAIAAAQDADRLQLACGPMTLLAPPAAVLRVAGGKQHGRLSFAPGDAVIVSGGTKQGVSVGQEFFVRRDVLDRFTPHAKGSAPASIHTVGWIRIVEAGENLSVATVSHGCGDGVMAGDYLEPFALPVVPAPESSTAAADFEHPARVVMGDERRQIGAAGSLMLVDAGSDGGVRAGQRVTLYRTTVPDGPVTTVGTATVLSVRPQTALIRIENSSEAVYIGDLAAIHR